MKEMPANTLVLTDIEKDFIKTNIKDFSPFQIANALKRSPTTVWTYARTLKEYRNRVDAKMKRSNSDRYNVVKTFERPPAVYSNHSPYRIASPGTK
jgi:FixJ family two-component response regulator